MQKKDFNLFSSSINLSFIFILLYIVTVLLLNIILNQVTIYSKFISVILNLCIYVPLLLIMINTKKLFINTFSKKNLFVFENVDFLKSITFNLSALSLISLLTSSLSIGNSIIDNIIFNFNIIGKVVYIFPESLMLLVLTLMSYILTKVFNEAIILKSKADTLEDENKFTI